jgi:hypothetical protein
MKDPAKVDPVIDGRLTLTRMEEDRCYFTEA